jgi:hypothetical protein
MGMTGTEIAVRIAHESRRGAESQGDTTIIVDTEASTPALSMSISPESSPAVPGSPESLSTHEEMLGLLNREVTPVEEKDLGFAGLF